MHGLVPYTKLYECTTSIIQSINHKYFVGLTLQAALTPRKERLVPILYDGGRTLLPV